jgi:hypothetical protein
MEVVELKRSIKQLSDSPHFIDHTKEIPVVVKIGLDTSWITSMFIKPEKVVIKSLNLDDPKEVKLIEKLQEDLLEQKIISENLQTQLAELIEEKRKQSLKQEELERNLKMQHEEVMAKQEALEKRVQEKNLESLRKQDETNVGIAAIMKMMKN